MMWKNVQNYSTQKISKEKNLPIILQNRQWPMLYKSSRNRIFFSTKFQTLSRSFRILIRTLNTDPTFEELFHKRLVIAIKCVSSKIIST